MKSFASLFAISAVCALSAGCAPAAKPPETPALASASVPAGPAGVAGSTAASPAPASEAPKEAPAAEPAALPTECANGDAKPCLPDAEFATRLCAGVYPEVALTLFGKTQPWTRAYLAGDTEAWNASGGKVTRSHMIFDEEVLVMARREHKGGIVVTGAAQTYDMLRWDGTCVSLESGEITFKKPPVGKSAPIPWRRLSEATRTALLAAPKVQASQKLVQKECAGAGAPSSSAKSGTTRCDKADAAFDRAIVEYVRSGGSLPTPARRP